MTLIGTGNPSSSGKSIVDTSHNKAVREMDTARTQPSPSPKYSVSPCRSTPLILYVFAGGIHGSGGQWMW